MSTRVITFHYTLTDNTGKQLDSSAGSNPLAFLEGSGQIIPGLETHLKTMKPGEKRKVLVPAKEAYGEVNAADIMEVSREKMPAKQIKIGDRFRAGNDGHAPVVRVIKVTDTHVTLDANHELAGQDLTFDVEVTAVREATAEELSHGHVHGPGGHHH
ncbi:MAG: FKBP-type peptidyl-prolyl cis-trans isomerase SlyD [Verrucomicrobiae bacterium]|nr:FKBP-type peptidyl-prolyl cis-trans isomerase SlyD [Verrucomicrobiae bacterium]